MGRFENRLQRRMQNPKFAEGYWEMDSEVQLMQALDEVRRQMDLSTAELAQRMGRHRETVSRLLHAEHANPTLDTLTDMLKAMHLRADVTLRPATENESPLAITVAVTAKQPT
jgi:transcriptional regulator with XRE-family HTH domain